MCCLPALKECAWSTADYTLDLFARKVLICETFPVSVSVLMLPSMVAITVEAIAGVSTFSSCNRITLSVLVCLHVGVLWTCIHSTRYLFSMPGNSVQDKCRITCKKFDGHYGHVVFFYSIEMIQRHRYLTINFNINSNNGSVSIITSENSAQTCNVYRNNSCGLLTVYAEVVLQSHLLCRMNNHARKKKKNQILAKNGIEHQDL